MIDESRSSGPSWWRNRSGKPWCPGPDFGFHWGLTQPSSAVKQAEQDLSNGASTDLAEVLGDGLSRRQTESFSSHQVSQRGRMSYPPSVMSAHGGRSLHRANRMRRVPPARPPGRNPMALHT